MSIKQVYIVLIAFLTRALALDYIFTLQEGGATACPGNENIFLTAYFDMSHLNWTQADEETIILQGYVIFLKAFNSSLHLNIQVQRLISGRWIETAFQVDRPDVCMTYFNEYEIWHDFVKDFEANSKVCPPEPGTKFDFNQKKLSTVLKDLSPGMEGTYRGLIKVFVPKNLNFCMIIEGDLIRKS